MRHRLTAHFLAERAKQAQAGGYPVPRWVWFCEQLLVDGYAVAARFSRSTVSKYVTVRAGGKYVVVRFSEHPHKTTSGVHLFVGPGGMRADQALAVVRERLPMRAEGVT